MKITHDLHVHTSLSLCADSTATVENYMETSRELGLKKIGFANHFWDEKIEGADRLPGKAEQNVEQRFYPPQNFAHLLSLKPEIERWQSKELQILFGCETEYDPFHRGVALTEERAEQFDFVIVPNSHTHITMPPAFYHPYQKHVDYMVQAYEDIIESNVSRYITAIAHPFGAVAPLYDYRILVEMIPDDCFKRLFDRTAQKGIAIEINAAYYHNQTAEEIAQNPMMRMYRIARECGCKFVFGSDAHSKSGHGGLPKAGIVADLLGLTQDDLAEIAK